MKPTVIVILGPTASGKSAYAIELAKKYNGEVISADSRQIYKGLDIGTGKVTKEEMQGIPHYLLDIKDPDEIYSATEWKKDAEEKIKEITSTVQPLPSALYLWVSLTYFVYPSGTVCNLSHSKGLNFLQPSAFMLSIFGALLLPIPLPLIPTPALKVLHLPKIE